jgi:putative ATP-binding cassette transporter
MGLTLGLMPLARANMALAEIDVLEQKLEVAARRGAPGQNAEDPWKGRVSTLTVRDIEYTYAANAGGECFQLGPLSLTIKAGKIVFVVGGNGSGKSTLLKILTGLYPPSSGVLLADGVAVHLENVASFRDMISAIYSDFHLFAKLYGLADVPDAAVRGLLARMRLEGQTSFINREFTKLTLSSGQKKRLAMIVALLEDRPICVFDEWAADQDPEFRAYFYDELLPALRQEGKVIIVVSHDDRYFHCADQVVMMEYGKIRSIDEHEHPLPQVSS